MVRFAKRICRLTNEDSGATTVEYAIMIALIIAVSFVAIGTVGSATVKHMDDSVQTLDQHFEDAGVTR